MKNKLVIGVLLAVAVLGSACKSKQSSSNTTEEKKTVKETSIEAMQKVVQDVIIKEDYQPTGTTSYRIKSYSIIGDTLIIDVTYKMDCIDEWRLYANGLFKKSLPLQADIYLERTPGNIKPCMSPFERTLKFNIKPLRAEGQSKVILNLNSAENKVEYSW